jgi:osmotically-inducible protein OsmY
MTKRQKLGVSLINAIMNNSALKNGTSISVGASKGTITLNGFVSGLKQKRIASNIARKQAPTYKIINLLEVKEPAVPS